MFRFASMLAFAVLLAAPSRATFAEEIRHSFFVAGPSFTGIIDEAGGEAWNSGKAAARDGWVLPNGNILIAWTDEIREYSGDKKEVIFRYAKSAENREIGTVERLADGNTLITELGTKPKLIEVDAAGKTVVEFPLQPETDNAHMQTRMARKLANGNYLVPHLLAFKVKEYSPKGEIVGEIKTDLPELGGRAAQVWPFTAIRLADGNTLVALTHGNKIAEFDAQGKVAWLVSNDDLPNKPFADPCGCQRLADGNTVVASYGAQKGIKLFEITREKQIVWKYEEPHRVHHFQILTTNGKPLAGKPLR
ncbi:MAG: hypothetical protein K8U03_01980 [Planctomycetia bacterium]|nr:hypothetical protein [Planctomycetia bacterium]